MTIPDLTRDSAAALLALGHVLIASWVSIHALLTKREVGRAISWIGLAWLSPMVGSLLYLLFGINRVARRARGLRQSYSGSAWRARSLAIPESPTDPMRPLRVAGNRVTGRPIDGGNSIEVLQDGDEAYPRMLAALDAARRSIALSTYIFEDDGVGQTFVAALARAHDRGVRVRVLIDGVGGGYFRGGAYRRLRRAGVPAARFLHTFWPWRMPFVNMRTHRKMLLVDHEVAFVGGMNIGAGNLRKASAEKRIRDLHFRTTGPIVGQLAEVFADDWLFAAGEPSEEPPRARPDVASADCEARVITSGPDQDLEAIEAILLVAISQARQSIRILTPYFLPDEPIVSALATAALRGVSVDIVTPERSDHRFFNWAMESHIGPLVACGCRVWRAPPPFEHAKLLTVDEHWVLIGSANWDVRSLRLNFELNVEVYDAPFAKTLDALISARLVRHVTSEEIAQTPLLAQLRNAAARLLLPYL